MTDNEYAQVRRKVLARKVLPKDERGEIAIPTPVRTTFGGAVYWGIHVLWQDTPWLVAFGGLGLIWQVIDSLIDLLRWF